MRKAWIKSDAQELTDSLHQKKGKVSLYFRNARHVLNLSSVRMLPTIKKARYSSNRHKFIWSMCGKPEGGAQAVQTGDREVDSRVSLCKIIKCMVEQTKNGPTNSLLLSQRQIIAVPVTNTRNSSLLCLEIMQAIVLRGVSR